MVSLGEEAAHPPVPVVLDTNILVADFHWEKAAFRLLLAEAEGGRVLLLVPKLVVQEAARRYAEQVVEAQRAYVRARRSLAYFGRPIGEELEALDIKTLRVSFEEELSKRVKAAGGLLADYPQPSHSDIVVRLLDGRKPFGAEGKGYRDTLIWTTVLDLAIKSDRILFVSNNSKDFANSKERAALHPDLLDDLEGLGVSTTKVELLPDLDAFVKSFVQPGTVILDEVTQRLSDDDFLARVSAVVDEAIARDLPAGAEIDLDSMDSPVENLTVANVEAGALHNLQVQDARMLDSGEAYIFLYAEVDADLEGFQYKADYYVEPDESPVELLSADWNEWYVHVGISTTIGIEVEAKYDKESKELSDGHVTATQVSNLWM